jgi:uncharacterized membrane protein
MADGVAQRTEPAGRETAIPRSQSRRLAWLDIARGLAVVAMIAYHTAWDLSELRLVETDVRTSGGWSLFARAIAATFLALSGVGLVLAHRGGVRPAAFARRLAVIGAAALAVTVATRFVFPDSYIFFGILHCLALSSLLALPFTRLPALAAAAAAAAVWAGPSLLTWAALEVKALDWPVLAFLGLGSTVPVTNDYVPVFPWSGFVLAGVALARSVRLPATGKASSGLSRPGRALAFAGRHSLAIYLLHQPLIFGALFGLVSATGPNPRAEAASFLRSCESGCREAGQSEATCRRTCACTVGEIQSNGLWKGALTNALTPDERRRIASLAQVCLARPD